MSGQHPYMTFNLPGLTQVDKKTGIAFDFNHGARVQVPKGPYHVRLIDRDACLTIYEADADGVIVTSTKKFYVDFTVEVSQQVAKEGHKSEEKERKVIFRHDYDCRGKNVRMKFPDAAMGDILAWFPYAEEFRQQHGCRLFCAMDRKFSAILAPNYPEITFIEPEALVDDLYASYFVGLFAPWDNRDLQPLDWRVVGLQNHAAGLLGLPLGERRVHLKPSGRPVPVKGKYVCIAAQATAQCKY